jgi:NAD(P)-dependent dehydrogenase (short-subunit alcohol dehydrogenase family)
MEMFDYQGRRAVVTGGGRGIGRAIALAFAGRGADVALAARSRSELEAVAAEITDLGRRAVVLPVDLRDTAASEAMIDEAARALGGLDILVNNGGGGMDAAGAAGELIDTTPVGFDHVFSLNVRTPLYAAMRAARVMIDPDGGGPSLTRAPTAPLCPAPGEALYGSAKAAIVNLTGCLAYELGPHRIRVNAIAPAVVETRLTERWLETADQRLDRSSFYPLGRVGRVEDVAAAAVYLCSEEAGWVSGVTLPVTGGAATTSDVFRSTRGHHPVPDHLRI